MKITISHIVFTALIWLQSIAAQNVNQLSFYQNKDNYDVIAYNLKIDLDLQNSAINARNTIYFDILDDLNLIKLDFAGLKIDSVKMGESSLFFQINDDQLFITLPQTHEKGTQDSVSIYYHGQPIRGLYFRTNSFGDTIVYSHNEPFDARYWIPVKDDPSDKAVFELTVRYPSKYKSVSNGILISTTDKLQGKKVDVWKEDLPIATYLVSLVCGKFDIAQLDYQWQNQSMPLQYYVYPEDLTKGYAALEATIDMLNFFNSYIGVYPFITEKYAMVEAPLREAAAMENQTSTTMRDRVMDNQQIIAHELAHQWWGNALTPLSFTDIWLNEGFATYFDALFTEFSIGKAAFDERMGIYSGNAIRDEYINYPLSNPNPDQYFSSTIYFKGAWVLHMLRLEVGDEIFIEIIREYFERYQFKSVNTQSFIAVCESVSKRNLAEFFNQWVYRPGIPRFSLSWTQSKDVLEIGIEQEQGEDVYSVVLDIQIEGLNRDTLISKQIDKRQEYFDVHFSDLITSVQLDPFNRILNQNNSPVYYIPETAAIKHVFPNPSNNQFIITYQLNRTQDIQLTIWNVLGEKVEVLQNSKKNSGLHRIYWEAESNASGVYFCILETTDSRDVRKLILVK